MESGGTTLPDDVVVDASALAKEYTSPIPFTRDVSVLTGADLTVREAEIVGIVGENGSGKSTLMQVLVGALDADSGTVTIDGTAGWCPQETLVYDRLTIRETFEFFGTAYGMSDAEIAEATEQLAERFGFTEFLDYRVDHLSGGNQQKVNLGVAIMHDPDVLFLDEPYTGFDWQTYLEFWELTEDLTAQGTAIVIISHFVSERERFDRICELKDGLLTDVTADGGTLDRPNTDPRSAGVEDGA